MRTLPSARRQQAAGATNDGQAERMVFWVAQGSLTPIDVRRVAQAHRASGRERAWHMPKDELDARPRLAANVLNQAVRARRSAGDALETETWELCCELSPLPPEAEPELVLCERERKRNAPLIRAKEGGRTAVA
jgi:hypothetical protein